jgi:hypothetical protein
MIEKILILLFSLLIVFLFSLNFNRKWSDRNYEKLKKRTSFWVWLRRFKIEETKDNFIKFQKGLSLFAISVMIISIIILLFRK